MTFVKPLFSNGDINRTGETLAAKRHALQDLEWAQRVFSNWRACHGYPINTFQATLRGRLKMISFDTMRLARMQDIGGLRAVVNTVAQVREVREIYQSSRFKHHLASEKDYIASPKTDGYRSVHLVFRYENDRTHKYNGLSIELSIRTRLQHAWATAVETMGMFLEQALTSRRGEAQWLNLFEITSSAFAWLEQCSRVPGYDGLSREDTYEMVRDAENQLVCSRNCKDSASQSTPSRRTEGEAATT